MTSRSDPELITRFKQGEISAFEELVRRYQDRVYNLCRYMVVDEDDARDAAQDTFIKACKGLKSYRPEAGFYTWLYRIAVNTCLDCKKQRRIRPAEDEAMIENVLSSDPSPEQLCESKETGRLIQAALAGLQEKLRTAIVLRELEELSYEEIADVLDVSVGTVKSRISRAREELRRLLRKRI